MQNLPLRPAAALLSRAALKHNLKLLRTRLKTQTALHSKNCQMMAVVKAGAYGHDVTKMGPELFKNGLKKFCVHSLEEAVELRKILAKADILVLGGTLQWNRQSVEEAKKHRLEVGINDLPSLRLFSKHPQIPLHLKFDTGMNRLGLKSDQWEEAISFINKKNILLEGVFTHFADFKGRAFRRQVMLFEELVRWFENAKIKPHWVHCENSGALFSTEKLKKGILSERCNIARPGISMYGYMPSDFPKKIPLKAVLQLVSEIGLVKEVDAGEGISYGHLYKSKRRHNFGVVSLGYADGVAKAYAQCLRPLWLDKNGKKKGQLEICGAVCMDMLMVRANRGRLSAKDRVVLWGRAPHELIQKKVADPYELNLRISSRIPRIWSR